MNFMNLKPNELITVADSNRFDLVTVGIRHFFSIWKKMGFFICMAQIESSESNFRVNLYTAFLQKLLEKKTYSTLDLNHKYVYEYVNSRYPTLVNAKRWMHSTEQFQDTKWSRYFIFIYVKLQKFKQNEIESEHCNRCCLFVLYMCMCVHAFFRISLQWKMKLRDEFIYECLVQIVSNYPKVLGFRWGCNSLFTVG